MKNIFFLIFFVLLSCSGGGPQTSNADGSLPAKENDRPDKYYHAIQGKWEDRKGEIFYIEGYEYRVFYNKYFYRGDLALKHDTIIGLAMTEFSADQSKIISYSADSLIILTLGENKIIRLHRPSPEALMRDTVTVKPDSIIKQYTKNILGHRFDFSHRADDKEHIFLRIKNLDNDTLTTFFEDIYVRGGNCNANIEIKSVYEINGDRLLFYTDELNDEHMDDRYHHYSQTYRIHEWVFRKNGQIISLGEKREKNDSLIQKLVERKIAELHFHWPDEP